MRPAQPRQPQQQRSPDLVVQLANFGKSIGLYARVAITLNVVIFACQKLFLQGSMHTALLFGFNYQSIVSAHQYYRILTSAFSHQGIAHILFNMCALAIFSTTLEKALGTAFFASLNLLLLLICSSLQLLYAHARIFWLPLALGGGATNLLVTYSYGYSGILFGLIMLLALTGPRHVVIYGCTICKIALPFIYLIASKMIAPNADMVGHISGILAALMIKYCGLYHLRLLPQYPWLKAVESDSSQSTQDLHEKLGYFHASEQIEKEFACCQTSALDMLRQRRMARLEQAQSRMQQVDLSTSISEGSVDYQRKMPPQKMQIQSSEEQV